jgi:hypothetical protein
MRGVFVIPVPHDREAGGFEEVRCRAIDAEVVILAGEIPSACAKHMLAVGETAIAVGGREQLRAWAEGFGVELKGFANAAQASAALAAAIAFAAACAAAFVSSAAFVPSAACAVSFTLVTTSAFAVVLSLALILASLAILDCAVSSADIFSEVKSSIDVVSILDSLFSSDIKFY